MKPALRNILFASLVLSYTSCNQKKQQSQVTKNNSANSKSFSVTNEIPIWTKRIPDSALITGEETIVDWNCKECF